MAREVNQSPRQAKSLLQILAVAIFIVGIAPFAFAFAANGALAALFLATTLGLLMYGAIQLLRKRTDAGRRIAHSSNKAVMPADPHGPRVLTSCRNETEAALVVNLLASIGIQARIAGTGPSTGWPEALGEVQVVVRQADLNRARDSLRDSQQKQS